MTRVQRGLLRVAFALFLACTIMIAITGSDRITPVDDEIPIAALASVWIAIILTKPRPRSM